VEFDLHDMLNKPTNPSPPLYGAKLLMSSYGRNNVASHKL